MRGFASELVIVFNMKNNFQKVMVTGLASIVCAGSMSIATLPNYSNLNSVDVVYAATIKDTAMTATGTVNSNVFLRKGPGTSYGKITSTRSFS